MDRSAPPGFLHWRYTSAGRGGSISGDVSHPDHADHADGAVTPPPSGILLDRWQDLS
jgi:hypothetical protein